MKSFLIKGFAWLAAGFVVLFGLRLWYGYLSQPTRHSQQEDARWNDNDYQVSNSGKSNYASMKFAKSGAVQAMPTVDQKYEKIGSVALRSGNFDEDEKNIRSLIKQYDALIQYEQSNGLAGRRALELSIGVRPEKFDEVLQDLRRVGKLMSLHISKTDKTNEFKELEAKRLALTKARDALVQLKSKSGKIEELMNLEDRILAVENEIQGLGVKLGEFDETNEFCTVKLTLQENMTVSGIPLAQRVKVAFEWTVKVYLGLMVTALFGLLSLLVLAVLIPKVKAVFALFNSGN